MDTVTGIAGLDYSFLRPEAITGPGDYIITYGPEPDMVFTANVFETWGSPPTRGLAPCRRGLEVQFKFGIVPGLLLTDLFAAATAVMQRVDRLAGRPMQFVSDDTDVQGVAV